MSDFHKIYTGIVLLKTKKMRYRHPKNMTENNPVYTGMAHDDGMFTGNIQQFAEQRNDPGGQIMEAFPPPEDEN